MQAVFDLSDLQGIRPFNPVKDHETPMWESRLNEEPITYLANDDGLWMQVSGVDEHSPDFEAITGFNIAELSLKVISGVRVLARKDGSPLLPFPFTTQELLDFDKKVGRVFSDSLFFRLEDTKEQITELEETNPKLAQLVKALTSDNFIEKQDALDAKERKERQAKGFYTVEEAAQGLAETVPGVNEKLMTQKLLHAFHSGKLVLRDTGDKLPLIDKSQVRSFIHLVKIDDLNAWLDGDDGFGAGYSWKPQSFAAQPHAPPHISEQDAAKVADWKMQIQIKAAELITTLRGVGASPTVHSILPTIVQWCRDNQVKTSGGIFPTAGYLRTHVLGGKHWKPPK